MRWIDYATPHSVREAVELLNEAGGNARPMAGGTDVLVQLRANAMPDVNLLVDVKNIPELNEVTMDPEVGLTLGAAVPCYKIYENKAIEHAYPGLIDTATLIGGTLIQGRASLGGNLCNAAPSGDSIPVMIALGCTARISGPNGNREVPVEDFCTGVRETVLQRGELLVSLHFPAPKSNEGANYLRFIPRNEMDIAVAGVGSSVVLDNGNIKSARVALASVAPTPLYVKEIGDAIAGKPANEETLQLAGQMARDAARPITDMRGTIEYRRHLCDVLTRRSLQIAIDRAKES
ncbi:MAG: xanthine dehydrogenase family protein subunit M [Chloroflexi bacterium]|nr:xanthine dehydrogenase family protein subunit M [Chloroflexota bacterium]MCH8869490.1 xanthine dehydrogenase family protein subunit M [Chloroflexota bacterium]MCI0770486.1 xanthine dehydrogenase family protein subunit M [Chloroflexota bacterium]MCI0790330.1 xanthine dehydrogenase family protein subunit M [Chloroflexota bacterium]MCI0795356.1 xanthine dehydrogenase family protein subunit M [Chloroflexota bacterium]